MSQSSHDDKFIITGQQPLKGAIGVRGAKNAALKALAASLILDQPSKVLNVPQIEDISRLVEIIEDLGVGIEKISGSDPNQIGFEITNPKIFRKKPLFFPS